MSQVLNSTKYTLGIINPSDIFEGIRGGSTGFISSILPYLNQNKVSIFGISKTDTEPWKSYLIHKNVKFIPIRKLKYNTRIPMRLKVFLSYMRYRKNILNSGVNVLYIQTPECCLPFLYGNNDVPVIYHQHGSGNPVAMSKFFYARGFLFRRLFELILRKIYQHSDWVIAIDKFCLSKAIKHGAQGKATLLMNAIDSRKFKPNNNYRIHARHRLGIKPNQYSILFVGRIAKTKGPARLLECIPFLKKSGLRFHIFFAGEGSYMPYVKDYVDKHKFGDCVTFLGNIPHEHLPHYYNMADVLVLPSDMEGVPMVVLEALACGTPVVASNVGGIPDIITNGVNGILVEDLSTKNLTRSITRVLDLKNDRKTISNTVDRFSSEKFVFSLNKIIEGVLDHSSKRSQIA